MHKPIRILLVDDSPHFLEAARDFLHLHEALEVAGTATEGQEALEQAQQMQPDVILLDLNLGTLSGLELIPVFKSYIPAAKIIVLTIMNDEAYRAATLQAGADAFVHKTEMSKTLISTLLELTTLQEPSKN